MTETTAPTPEQSPTLTPAATGGTTPESTGPVSFSQEQVDAIVRERLDRQQRALDARTAKDRADAEAAKLAEQGEFKKLAESAQAERDALKATLAQRDHADLQRTVAAEHRLPAEMASRLQGTTREELAADAKALAAFVATPATPPPGGNRPNPRPQSGPDAPQETEQFLRQSGRYTAI